MLDNKIAWVVAASAVFLQLSVGPVNAFADDSPVLSMTSEGDTAYETDPSAVNDNFDLDSLANSFRYPQIAPLSIDDRSAADAVTWTRAGNTYYGSNGIVATAQGGLGIDVSEHNGKVDWSTVKSSGLVDFAIIRAGYGSNESKYDDKRFVENVRGCIDNDIPFGVYLYSYASDEQGATSEAQHVLRLLSNSGLTPGRVSFPVFLDLEQEHNGKPSGLRNGKAINLSNSELERIAAKFCSIVSGAGYTSGVYANLNWWNNYLTNPFFGSVRKWVAQYNIVCEYSGAFEVWQCSSRGSIPGVSGNVDINFDFTGKYYEPTSPEGAQHVYRLYNPNSGEHLYTFDKAERDMLTPLGWIYEGIAWNVPLTSSVPVYRLYNPNNGDHHYTTDKSEVDKIVPLGWIYEGVFWHSTDSSGVPIYRLFNPYMKGAGNHHFTTSLQERDWLVSLGWKAEGVAYYGLL